MERIRSLTDYLMVGSLSLESIIRFVALDTLYELSAMTLFLNVVRSDGSVFIPAGFGYPQDAFDLISERSVAVDTPVNQALRTSTITLCGSYEEYLFSGPNYAQKLFPRGFASSFAWPIPDVGVVATFSSEKLEFSESLIRQETVQISRKLGVSGRKELLNSPLDSPVQSIEIVQ